MSSPPEEIALTTKPGFWLILRTPEDSFANVHKIHTVRIGIDKKKLETKSKYFRALMNDDFFEKRKSVADLEVESLPVAQLIIEIVHGLTINRFTGFNLKNMRSIVSQCDYWDIDHRLLTPWFENWYCFGVHSGHLKCAKHIGGCICRAQGAVFLFYTFRLDHEFFHNTWRLILLCSRRVEEVSDPKYPDLVLPPRILRKSGLMEMVPLLMSPEQCNGVRGSMRGQIEKGLMDWVEKRIVAGCGCKHDFIKGFYREMTRLGLYPNIHLVSSGMSIDDILSKLDGWKYSFKGCQLCGSFRAESIRDLTARIRNRPVGLCLTCISKPRRHENPEDSPDWPPRARRKWSWGCKVKHGKLTWIFSYYAREESRREDESFNIFKAPEA